MKKTLLIVFSGCIVLFTTLLTNNDVHSNGGGAPAGYTGSPLENNNRTCSSTNGGCHGGGGVSFQNGLVTSNVPECGYTPGQTYSITVYVTSANRTKFGFSISPQLTNGNTGGSMIASPGTQLNGGGRYLTHTSSGTTQTGTNERTWTFDWIAPAAGSGDVTFYAALNATNSNNGNSGDLIFNSTLSVFESIPPDAPQITGNNSSCEGNPITISTNYPSGIVWQPGGQTSQDILVTSSGTYTVEITTACGNATSLPFEVTIGTTPATPNISINGFGNLQSSVLGNYTYNWYLDGALVATTDSASYSPQSSGEYTLSITSTENCSSIFSAPFPVNGVSLSKINSKKFEIYPNPSSGVFNIIAKESQSEIIITDLTGKLITKQKLWVGLNLIDLKANKGVFVLRYQNENYRISVVD